MNGQKNFKKQIGYRLLTPMAVAYLYFGTYKIAIEEAQWDVRTAFLTMLILVIIGEVISIAMKTFVPSMFATAVLFVVGFRAFLLADALQQGGITANLPTFLAMMTVVHLGTMLDIQELIDQWKTIVTTLVSTLSTLVVTLTVGALVLGREIAAVAVPPLTGGFVATIMMQSVTPTEHLAIFVTTVYVLQDFMGYPLTNIRLKREGYSVLNQYREGIQQTAAAQKTAAAEESKHVLFPQLPGKYESDFTHLFTMVILTVMSGYLDRSSGEYIPKFVWALVLGVFVTVFGFVEKNVLVHSHSTGFVYTIIMVPVSSQFSSCMPDTMVQLIKDFAISIVLSAIGVTVFVIPPGKKLGMSTPMASALGLGPITGGFLANYTLNVEVAKACAENEEEYQVLKQYILPKTLVADSVNATFGSAFIVGAAMTMSFR